MNGVLTRFLRVLPGMGALSHAGGRRAESHAGYGMVKRLGVYPRLHGQYQNLMLSAFDTGTGCAEVRDLKDMERLSRTGALSGLWINFDEKLVVPRRRDRQASAARRAIRTFGAMRTRGVPLALTLHNAKPHETCDMAAFDALRGYLLTEADLVHVHNNAGRELALLSGTPEARIGVVPHPSYLGSFPATKLRSRAAPRPRFLSFGSSRPYKGHDLMLEAFATMPDPGRVAQLTLAGEAREDTPLNLAQLDGLMPVRRDARSIPDEDVPALFAAHDWAVMAYRSSLTSGVALMALTFGLPCVAPDIGGMRELLTGPLGAFLFTPNDAASMAAALDRAASVPPEDWLALHQAALERAEELHPQKLSARFKALLAQHALLPVPGMPRDATQERT